MYENAVVGFDYNGRKVTFIFAKWIISADEPLLYENYPEICQIPVGSGAKFLLQDDGERDLIQAALVAAGISFDRPIEVSLTAQQRQWIIDSGITQREDVESVISRAERIDAITTLEELKVEIINSRSAIIKGD